MPRRLLTVWTLTVVLSAAALTCALPTPASASITLGTANTKALSTGLVGYWTFDGPATNWRTNKTADSSGNNNTGTLVRLATSTSPTSGKIGSALWFNVGLPAGDQRNTASWIALASTSATSINTNLTISVWVYPTAQNCYSYMISKGGTFSGNGQYALVTGYAGTSNAYIGMNVGNGTTGVLRIWGWGASTLPLRKWTHIACSTDTTNIYCYVNGVSAGAAQSRSTIGSDFTGDTWFVIGTNNANQAYFRGGIDDVRIYNRALSATEVALLYAVGQAGVGRSPAPATSKSAPLSAGLIGYWTFDGPVTNWRTNKTADSSGNNNTGTLVGMSTSTSPTAGKIGQALKFNGISAYVSLVDNSLDNLSTFTASTWVKFGSLGSQVNILSYGDSSNTNYYMQFGKSASNKYFYYVQKASASDDCYYTSAVSLSANSWYHLVLVNNGSSVVVYMNGQPEVLARDVSSECSTLYSLSDIASNAEKADLGALTRTSTIQYLNGSIDDVRIYNRALSANEIKQLYAAGATNIAHSNTMALSNGLVGRWSFDGPTVHWDTRKVDDSSGNNNTGQLMSMSTSTSPTPGKIGQALKFVGSSNKYINLGNVLHLASNGSFTISAWAKPNNTNVRKAILTKSNGSNHAGFEYGFWLESNGKVVLAIDDGTAEQDASGNTSYTAGVWQHFVVQYDSVVHKFYFYRNGVADGIVNYTLGTPNSNLVNTNLGAMGSQYYPFNGSLDDVRIYNRALSAQEVQQLYLMGR